MGATNSSGTRDRPHPREAAPARLVCALSADERRLFFGGAREQLAALPAPVWLETSREGGSRERLAALNPAILLTGWSTGALPVAWLESAGCALRYVCHLAGSVRRLVPRSFIERGGVVSNWDGIPSTAVAEQALLLALAALRNEPAWSEAERHIQDTPRRIERLGTRSLFGRRVGIHGFGRIARALVVLLQPFGVGIEAFSAGVPDAVMRAAGVCPCSSLGELFARNEIIFECEGLTPANTGLVSASALAALPDGAVFVNVARGQLVDEAALLREAKTGRVRVALDVIAQQPWEQAAEAFRAAGAVVSPHVGGPTFDQYPRCGEFALRNVARFLRGEPPEAQVSLADYDRAT